MATQRVDFTCWADSVAGVERMEAALREEGASSASPLEVCVELGADGVRTGARTVPEAVAVAERIVRSPVLRLAGVAGYEGALAHDRSAAAHAAVTAYLERMLELHRRISHLYDDGEVMVTAGGSVYFDLVADVFGPVQQEFPRTAWVLRSGAYVIHDHGIYAELSPLAHRKREEENLRAALTAVAQVVSRPEPHLAYLDAGKRDLAYDEGLPVPLGYARAVGDPWQPLPGATVTAMNDQHAFVDLGASTDVEVGDVMVLGMSHPCAMVDRWRTLPVVAPDGTVVDLVHTYF